MMTLIREIHDRNPILSWTGRFHFALIGLFLIADDRTILGIDPWIKPTKFAISNGIFLWTMAYLLEDLKADTRSVSIVSRVIAVAMLAEIVCIGGQSLRGVPSHFNFTTTLNALIFSIMGIMILLNTVAVLYVGVLFFIRHLELSETYLWGIRWGIALFLIGSAWGNSMVNLSAHTIGAPDGGPGLPILNWSTVGGDLRIAHAMGLHALQFCPLIGHLVGRRIASGARWPILALAIGFYGAGMFFLYHQAVSGEPLIGNR